LPRSCRRHRSALTLKLAVKWGQIAPRGRTLVQKLPDGRAEHGVEARVLTRLDLASAYNCKKPARSTRMSEHICTRMSIFLRIQVRVPRNSKRQVMGEAPQPGGAKSLTEMGSWRDPLGALGRKDPCLVLGARSSWPSCPSIESAMPLSTLGPDVPMNVLQAPSNQ